MLPSLRNGRLCPQRAREAVYVWLFVRLVWLLVALPFGERQSPAALRFMHRDAAGRAYVHMPVQALDMWTRQDAALYAELARDGYPAGPPSTLCAFFPAYPALIRALAELTAWPLWLCGLVLGNVCDLLAWVMVWRYFARRLDVARAGLALWAFAAFPSRNFGFSGYTEGPYLLAVATALGAAHALDRQQAAAGDAEGSRGSARSLRPLIAAASAALIAGGLRPPGALLGGALAVASAAKRQWGRALLLGASAAVLPALLMVHLRERTGDPLAFAHVQAQWHRRFSYLGEIFLSDGKGPDHIGLWLGLLATLMLWRQKAPLYERLFVTGSLALPMLTGNVMSMLRFVGVLVPLFAVPLERPRPRWAVALYFLVAAGMSVGFAVSVGQGRRVM